MIRTVLQVALALAIAIGGGAWSVWAALKGDFGRQTVVVGPWRATPGAGDLRQNPYALAQASRGVNLPLGLAEGLAFRASTDSQGNALDAACSYRISGPLPAARFWTLHAEGAGSRGALRLGAMHSLSLLRAPDNGFVVTASSRAEPGNWLAIGPRGGLELALVLYDTPISGNTALGEIDLPAIERLACRG